MYIHLPTHLCEKYRVYEGLKNEIYKYWQVFEGWEGVPKTKSEATLLKMSTAMAELRSSYSNKWSLLQCDSGGVVWLVGSLAR